MNTSAMELESREKLLASLNEKERAVALKILEEFDAARAAGK